MRAILIIAALPFLALAACGYRNFEKPDGTFDREGYRSLMGNACGAGIMAGDASIPAETRSRVCNCVMDRMLARSDEELRATVHDRETGDRAQEEAMQSCVVSLGLAAPAQPVFDPQSGRWVAPAAPVLDEQPPPAATGMAPPPVVQPPHEAENRRAVEDAARQMDEATRAAESAMRDIQGR